MNKCEKFSSNYILKSYRISILQITEATRVHGEVLTSTFHNQKMITMMQSVGPAALITPWNFPSAMITRKLGPALAAGCTVVLKPSEETPISALAICAIAEEAGVPPGTNEHHQQSL